jgi:1,4-dihydroxy-2-naphthoate octaprenyltransferase
MYVKIVYCTDPFFIICNNYSDIIKASQRTESLTLKEEKKQQNTNDNIIFEHKMNKTQILFCLPSELCTK